MSVARTLTYATEAERERAIRRAALSDLATARGSLERAADQFRRAARVAQEHGATCADLGEAMRRNPVGAWRIAQGKPFLIPAETRRA